MVLPDLRGGGAERVSVDLARAFVNAGCDVEFVLMRAVGDFLADAGEFCEIVDLSVSRIRDVSKALSEYLRQRRPDALIAHMWPLTVASVVARYRSGLKCPLLLVEHNTLSLQYGSRGALHQLALRGSISLSYRFADHIAAVSSGAARDLARIGNLRESSVRVLHNPIPLKPAPSDAEIRYAETFWSHGSGKRLLAVGSLTDQKNYPLLFRALASLAEPNHQLIILGEGPNDESLRNLAFSLGVADKVTFPGFQPNPAAFYATADVFVLSSSYEGLPTVLIEALSFGLKIVATDCPSGPSEILGNGKWGRLVPVGDSECLAAAIVESFDSPVDCEALKQRAAAFSPDVAAGRYLDLLSISPRETA